MCVLSESEEVRNQEIESIQRESFLWPVNFLEIPFEDLKFGFAFVQHQM